MIGQWTERPKVVKKLLDQYHKHGRLIIAYDFDDTVSPLYEPDEFLNEVRTLIRKAAHQGHYCYCYTANTDFVKVSSFLQAQMLPTNPIPKGNGDKAFFNILLDDKAGLEYTYNVLFEVLALISIQK